jgi:acyl carrier protein
MKKTDQIIELLKNMFEDIDTSDFDLDTEFKNNDEWDSMTALTLITLIDDEFNISISGEKIKELNTIRDLMNYLNE